MATQCRAADPNTCRIHSNNTISQLQAQADQAALSGNINDYVSLREQIDAAHDAIESQSTKTKPTPAKRLPRKTAQQMITDGANAGLKLIADWREMEADERPEAPDEEIQMGKRGLKEEVEKSLREGKKKKAAEVEDNLAFILFESYYQGNPPHFATPRDPYFQTLANTILKAASK